MDLAKIGKRTVVTVMKFSSVNDAAGIMRDSHVGDVVVVEFQGLLMIPVGMLTDRDIVMATTALGVDATKLLVEDIMTISPVSVHERESLTRVIELMKTQGVKRLPILGDSGELTGIVTLEDIMSLLASELSALAEVAQREKEVELETRRRLVG